MQFLIDIIKEWLQLNHGYFDRGDAAAWDFQIGDFTKDGAWHDLVLPALVPVNARAVHFTYQFRASAVQKAILFSGTNATSDFNLFQDFTQVTNFRVGGDFIVRLEPDTRKIRYLMSAANITLINVVIRGWWL